MGHDFESADITGAYLNADLSEPEFMRIPPDLSDILVRMDPNLSKFVGKGGSMIVKLKKALYGLKSSGKLWYQLLSETLTKIGFTRSSMDKYRSISRWQTTQLSVPK